MQQVPHISDSEWEIMKVVWKRSPRSAQSIVDALAKIKDWHPKTIKTLITRLVKKGALEIDKSGKTYLYAPAVTRRVCVRSATTSFIRRVYDGALTPMIASFFEEEILSEDDVRDLRRLLAKKGAARGKRD
jgi:BlaI family penicillinase repressor